MGNIKYLLNQDDIKKFNNNSIIYKDRLNKVFEISYNDVYVLNIYITKEFLIKYSEVLTSIYKIDGFKQYNLYCDFIDDDKLIEEFKDMYNIKEFKTINKNDDMLISKFILDALNLFFDNRTNYFKNISNIKFNGIYVEDAFYIQDGLIFFDYFKHSNYTNFSIMGIIRYFFKDKVVILKSNINIDSIEYNKTISYYNKLIIKNDKNKVLYDYNYTFLGLFDEYLENENKFNKTYKDIKFLSNISKKDRERYNNIDKNKIIKFYKKIGLSDNIINFMKNSYSIFSENYLMIVYLDDDFLDVFLNEYANKNDFYQFIILNSFSFYKGNSITKDVIFTTSIFNYFKHKNKFKNAINFLFYVDEKNYNRFYLLTKKDNLLANFMKLDYYKNYYILKYVNNVYKVNSKYDSFRFKIKDNKELEHTLKVIIRLDNFIFESLV